MTLPADNPPGVGMEGRASRSQMGGAGPSDHAAGLNAEPSGAGRPKAAKEALDRGVSIGIVISAAYCARYHGEDTLAEELLEMAGLTTMADMRRIGADAYDVSALRGVMRYIAARRRALSDAAAQRRTYTAPRDESK
jgi:hypothetical protein